MYKIQRIKVNLDSCEHRLNKKSITLYSYDVNNNVMEIKVVDEFDDLVKVSNYDVEILSVFEKSGKKWTAYPQTEDDKIIFKFDTSLIDRDEVVRCHIYLSKTYDDGSTESCDVAVFEFRVRLSLKHVDMEDKQERVKKPEYLHLQTFTSSRWHIVHNLGKYPQVTILDSSKRQVFGEVQHLSDSELVVIFAAPFQGQAQLD